MVRPGDPVPLTVVDVETTGLARDDRVVSLAAIHVPNLREMAGGRFDVDIQYLAFNPGRPSHPRARAVHGFSDAALALQDRFDEHAQDLSRMFSHGGIVVAHNASFDRRFVLREFKGARVDIGEPQFECTMLQHRARYGSPSGLDAVLRQMGLPARPGTHGALEDAWFALMVFCWLNDWPVPSLAQMPKVAPTNWRDVARPTSPKAVASAPAPVAPPPVAGVLEAAMARVRPLATIMMAVARADGLVLDAEVESLSLLIDTTLSGTATGSDSLTGQLLEVLAALEPDEAAIDAACDAIVADPNMAAAVAGWVRQITFADGNSSDREARAIFWISERMRAAHARRNASRI